MAKEDAFADLDLLAQADLVRRKEVKPGELVEAAIARIERLNPQINAVIRPMYDLARAAASGPLPEGPFTGVPYLLKDLGVAYAGVPLTGGAVLNRDFVPDFDSELVVRLKRAGLIVLGKTNTPEFGLPPTTEPRLFGATHNPWDTSRTPGGSSGGSAAAVAARMVPAAHASDGGGSIRIPASCCGVFGLKVTRGRNPQGPEGGDYMGRTVDHAVTISVRDSAALLDATAGPDLGAPYWAQPPARPFLQEVGANPGRLRIAFSTEAPTGVPVHPDCVAAVLDAAKLCEELGHHVVEAAPEIDREMMRRDFTILYETGVAALLDNIAERIGRLVTEEDVEPLTWGMYQWGKRQNASRYLQAAAKAIKVSRKIAGFFVDHDILLTPVLAEPPVPLGAMDPTPEDPLAGWRRSALFAAFTSIFNTTGQPAMSVPLYWNAEGLPIGTQFVARYADEAMLFRLAAQLEAARPWANRRPPVSA